MIESAVWKFPLKGVTNFIEMPLGAKPLRVAYQAGELQLWALVDRATSRLESRCFFVVGTGQDFFSHVAYLGSVTQPANNPQGEFVWHVFEHLDPAKSSNPPDVR